MGTVEIINYYDTAADTIAFSSLWLEMRDKRVCGADFSN